MNYDPREISILVRDGLLLLKEQETGAPPTLIEELEAEANTSLRWAQNLVDSMARQERLWLANGMNAAIDAGAATGGTFSCARWLEIRKMFLSFGAWVKQAVDGETPPIVVISRRGNPPEPAPEQPEPEPEETEEE